MTLILMDGFDTYDTGDFALHWTSGASMAIIGTSPVRALSRRSLYLSGANVSPAIASFGTDYVQGVIGFGFYFTNSAASRNAIARILDGTSEQISIRTNSSSVLIVSRSGTTLATGSTVLTSNTWYYIELKFTIGTGTAGAIELKLNGASEIAATSSLNTRATSNTLWNGLGLVTQNQAGTAGYYDDVYALDPTSGTNTDFLGPVSIIALAPSAAGNAAAWTPSSGTNHGAVSETAQDGDTTFNQSSTANQIDTFAYQNLPIAAGSVYAVQHVLVAKHDGGARSIAPVCRQSSTDYVGTTRAVSSTYAPYKEIREVDPATSSAWTVSGVNSAEFGYKLIS